MLPAVSRMLCRQLFATVPRRVQTIRKLSTDIATTAPKVVAESSPASKNSGSSFFDRFFSFLVGCGVGFGTSFYFIQEELLRANAAIDESLVSIGNRVKSLEDRK